MVQLKMWSDNLVFIVFQYQMSVLKDKTNQSKTEMGL